MQTPARIRLLTNIRISNCLIEDYQRDGDKGGNDGEGIHGAGITLSFCKNFVVSDNRIIQHEPPLQTNREEIKGPYAGLKQNYQSTALEIISCLYGTVTGNLIDTSPIFRTPEKGCGVVVKCPKN